MIRINLLPVREEKKRADVRHQLIGIAGAVVVTIAACAVFHHSLRVRKETIRSNISNLNGELAQYQEQLEQVKAFRKQKEEIETKLSVIRGLERARSGPVHMLDELATRVPDRLWITRLRATADGQIELEGMSLDNERVADLLTRLEESPYFDSVELEGTEFEERSGLKLARFEVRATLSHPGEEHGGEKLAAAAAPGRGPGGGR